MIERSVKKPTTYERLKRTLAKPGLGVLGALAFVGGNSSTAESAQKPISPKESSALTAPLVVDPAAILKSRIVHRQVVTYSAFQGVDWGSGEANQTSVPLEAQVDGHTDYFSVTQTQPNKRGTLRTLRVTELVNLAPDAIVTETFPGVTVANSTPTQSGIVMLAANKLPIVEVPGATIASTGKPLFALVGQTIPNPFPPSQL